MNNEFEVAPAILAAAVMASYNIPITAEEAARLYTEVQAEMHLHGYSAVLEHYQMNKANGEDMSSILQKRALIADLQPVHWPEPVKGKTRRG